MRKVKIIGKGLPKYQQQPGTVTDFRCPAGQKFDENLGQCVVDIDYSIPQTVFSDTAPEDQRDVNGCIIGKEEWSVEDRQCVPIGQQYPQKNQTNKTLSKGTPKTGYGTGVNPQKTVTPFNFKMNPYFEIANVITSALSRTADTLQNIDLQRSIDRTQKRFGMTDSRFAPTANVYSYGRTPTGYAYNQMVPVQFAGIPTFEAMTVPQFAQDGIVVSRDILNMPDLYPVDVSRPILDVKSSPVVEAPTTVTSPNVPVYKQDVNTMPAAPVLGPADAPTKEVSYSHNNPLNIHYGGFTKKYGATKGAYDNMGNVAIFPDLNAGIQAAKDLLFNPNSVYFNLRISEARNRWVNGDVDQTSESTRHIVKSMGKDVKLADLTPIERDKLIKQFAKWEGKQGYNAIKDLPLFKEGGVYELNDNEIQQILANGGQIEFL